MNINLDAVTVTEFGVGRDNQNDKSFAMIPVDADVQTALLEMVKATDTAAQKLANEPALYEPSEKYETTEFLYLPLSDDMAAEIRHLHEAVNLDIDTNALSDHDNIFCYFARFRDNQGKRLTAFRRSTQFKGILKSRNRLVRLLDDSLRFVDDDIFKLDNDFDFLVDSENIYIHRPSGFEFAGKLTGAILGAVPKNIEIIKNTIPFVDFGGISEYAKEHPRAARYLASIIMKREYDNIGKEALQDLCKKTGVDTSEKGGKIIISMGSEMGFLEVLDRRRYEIELINGQPEKFRAGSRTRL
jgi:hypothetical protein